jgi:hypothetical protein
MECWPDADDMLRCFEINGRRQRRPNNCERNEECHRKSEYCVDTNEVCALIVISVF